MTEEVFRIYEKYSPSVVGLILKNRDSEEEAYDVC